MNKYTKFGIFFLTTLLTLSFVTKISLGDTTIEDSSFPAVEGDFFKWVCTYNHPEYTGYIEKGSWWNITIERIYQDSYMAIPNALIVNATVGVYIKGANSYSYDNKPFYIVYNSSLHFIYTNDLVILPIPLNLTMVAYYYELNLDRNCTIDGNTLIVDIGSGIIQKYTYNSHGISTLLIREINNIKYLEYSLVDSSKVQISYGNYYIIAGIVSIAIIVIFMKKQFNIK